nr:G2/mitotic-specific cyclin-5 [Crypthecodinium cohnii]
MALAAANNRPRQRRASLTASALESSSKLLGPLSTTSTALSSLSTASTSASSVGGGGAKSMAASAAAALREGSRLLSGPSQNSRSSGAGCMEEAKFSQSSIPPGAGAPAGGSLHFAPETRSSRGGYGYSKAPMRRSVQTAMATSTSTSSGGFGPIRSQQQSSSLSSVGQPSLRDVTNVPRSTSSHPFQKQSARNLRVPGSIVGPGKLSQQASRKTTDIFLNPASEYIEDIVERMFQEEGSSVLPSCYLDHQAEVTAKMRSILVDWLVDVHLRFSLRSSTLFLSINLLDRFLAREPIRRRRLQLLGVVATLVATKFEEVNTPPAEDFVYLTRHAYTVQDIFDLECRLLATLDFRVLTPTAPEFFEHFWRAYQGPTQQLELAQYLLELTLLEASMVQYEPSKVAAAAILLSCDLGPFPCNWTRGVAELVRHPLASLQAPMNTMNSLFLTAEDGELKAIPRKFQSVRQNLGPGSGTGNRNGPRRKTLGGTSPAAV